MPGDSVTHSMPEKEKKDLATAELHAAIHLKETNNVAILVVWEEVVDCKLDGILCHFLGSFVVGLCPLHMLEEIV